jgi:hypothetical protein
VPLCAAELWSSFSHDCCLVGRTCKGEDLRNTELSTEQPGTIVSELKTKGRCTNKFLRQSLFHPYQEARLSRAGRFVG